MNKIIVIVSFILVSTAHSFSQSGVPTLKTGWPKSAGERVFSSPVLGNIDADGKLEIVVGSYDNEVYAFKADGSLVPGWPKQVGGSFSPPRL